jgi:hypothetical protein
VERLGSAFVKLWNNDESAAHDVHAEASEDVRMFSANTPPVEGVTIHAGTGARIGAAEHDFSGGAYLTIHWRNQPDGEVKELIYQL